MSQSICAKEYKVVVADGKNAPDTLLELERKVNELLEKNQGWRPLESGPTLDGMSRAFQGMVREQERPRPDMRTL